MIILVAEFVLLVCLTWLFAVRKLNIEDYVEISIIPIIAAFMIALTLSIVPAQKPAGPYRVPIVQFKERDTNIIQGGGSFLGWTITSSGPQYVIMQKKWPKNDSRLLESGHDLYLRD